MTSGGANDCSGGGSGRAGWVAVVLAGDRGRNDPVARATGARCKAMVDVAGAPLLGRVLDTLARCDDISECCVVGPDGAIVDANPALRALVAAAGVRWIAPGASPVASALAALDSIAAERPVLITTADHALLTPCMVATMCRSGGDLDLGVGLVEHARVQAAYPTSRRTATRLGAHAYCGCNLFALYRPAGRTLVERWRRVENERKHPARIVAGMLGWPVLIRYALRALSLESAFARLSKRHGLRAGPVLLDDPNAAVDVDSLADLRQVEAILRADD
ncbi:nucleotidyltransferase family protein [Salinisphaera sp.]|uniref:nucleotidyltransferase family protein n=1 Tax=Salinisphaera sp. TaxID=1914330 RepID=UPI002D76D43D|nr:nucleotidyltransferase family protein [Salinisphaera sp.]HET7313152.1 nucleotidyltransferase family protein [Salinisphaera sp.]